jgi:hypothetical protein
VIATAEPLAPSVGFLFCIVAPPNPGAPSSSKILNNSGNGRYPGRNPYSLNSGKTTITIRFGTRKVKKDNTFSFSGRRYETTVDLRDKQIQVRFDRRRLDTTAVIIYHKGQRMGPARLLDAVANGLKRRKEKS